MCKLHGGVKFVYLNFSLYYVRIGSAYELHVRLHTFAHLLSIFYYSFVVKVFVIYACMYVCMYVGRKNCTFLG